MKLEKWLLEVIIALLLAPLISICVLSLLKGFDNFQGTIFVSIYIMFSPLILASESNLLLLPVAGFILSILLTKLIRKDCIRRFVMLVLVFAWSAYGVFCAGTIGA